MDESPTQKLMAKAYAEQQKARRDQLVVMDCAGEAVARLSFDVPRDGRELRRMLLRAAEDAARLAIEKERELHAEDMATLQRWAELQIESRMLAPAQGIVTEGEDPSGASVSEAN